MELHTLGVDGPYTEDDVREVARCFTGWGFIKSWQQGETGTFIYRPADHDNGAKTVLGTVISPGGGMNDGLQVLDMLASHRSTISFVTRKLATWFLGYAPPEKVIIAAMRRWAATDGDLREVIRTFLSWRYFNSAQPLTHRKLKRPFHWMTSLYRSTEVDLINRWRQASNFSNGWYWSTSHTIDHMRTLLGGAPKSAWARTVSQVLTGGALDSYEEARIQDYLDTFSNESNQAVGEAFELVASAPSFQRY